LPLAIFGSVIQKRACRQILFMILMFTSLPALPLDVIESSRPGSAVFFSLLTTTGQQGIAHTQVLDAHSVSAVPSFDAASLADADIVYLWSPIDPDELGVLDDFVRAGGRLILMGDHGTNVLPFPVLGPHFGVEYSSGPAQSQIAVARTGFPNPLTNGPAGDVATISVVAANSGLNSTNPDFQAVAQFETTGGVAMGYLRHGAGEVLFLTDLNTFDDTALGQRDNQILWSNLFAAPRVAIPITAEEVVFDFDLTDRSPSPPYDHIVFSAAFDVTDPIDVGDDSMLTNVYGDLGATSPVQSRNDTLPGFPFDVSFNDDGTLYGPLTTANPIFDPMLDGSFSFGLEMLAGSTNLIAFTACGRINATGEQACITHPLVGDGGTPPPGGAVLVQAAQTSTDTRVTVGLSGDPLADLPDVEIMTSLTCDGGTLDNPDSLGVISDSVNEINGTMTYDDQGAAFVVQELDSTADQYAAARLTGPGGVGSLGECVVIGPDNDAWTRAREIALTGVTPPTTGTDSGFIDVPGRARWYKFSVQPNAKAVIELSGLPTDYDLVVFKDISQAYEELAEGDPSDVDALNRLGAEFAPSILDTSEISPFAFSPSEISPFAFSPFAFSPFAFSPSVYASESVAPFAFSPFAFSPSAVGGADYSPFAFSPFAFSPFAFSPFAFSPEDYSSAQVRSVIAVSAQAGTTAERLGVLTWNNTGDFYVRVASKNGSFDSQTPFELSVSFDGGLCTGVDPVDLSSISGAPGNYQSILLYDSSRLTLDGYSAAEVGLLAEKLSTLSARPEVNGVVVDLGGVVPIQVLHAQADEANSCPYAENLTAAAIKHLIDEYRAQNPDLTYIVLAGSDGQIPFFRYPDQTLLGPELNYDPPMQDETQSKAALALNYVLGQDQYGARTVLSLNSGEFPVPDLAVGRLVETPLEMITVIDAYLSTEAGVADTPTSSLVTGYDFLQDAADAIQLELQAGLAGAPDARNDTLITDASLSPDDPLSWNANALATELFADGEDIIFLAGHFNAFSALAADFSTSLLSTELLAADVDLTNALVFSAGCHSGYNAVNEDVKIGVELPPDWAQAFATKGATLVAGTGYQYGDTEFIEFGERLYLEFARELRTGTEPVAIGQALVAAKQTYLAQTPDNKGLHRKSLLISTIFGLPMLKIDMPGDRIIDVPDTSDVFAGPVTSGPGAVLNLQSATVFVDLTGELEEQFIEYTDLSDPSGTSTIEASYLTGPDGLSINPAEPVLPLTILNVTVPDQSLRGVGFRGGLWSESLVVPVDGAATTELRAPHTKFASLRNYPMVLARPNYYAALTGGGTFLNVTPVQHRVENIGDPQASRRQFSRLDYQLFYSDNTVTYNANVPALAAPPTLSGARAVTENSDIVFIVNAVGDPAAGMQSVWVTYTDGDAPSGEWLPLDLVQDPLDSRLWTGRLEGAAGIYSRLDAIFHAVNGVGLVTMDDNFGAYYQIAGPIDEVKPDGVPASQLTSSLQFEEPVPAAGMPGNTITVSAFLMAASGAPLVDETVLFRLGATLRSASTDSAGRATAEIPVYNLPGEYALVASFAGEAGFAASSDERQFLVEKAPSRLVLIESAQTIGTDGIASGISARLTADVEGSTPLQLRTVYFTLSGGPVKDVTIPAITDFQGVAELGELVLPAGSYSLSAQFLGVIPDATDEIVDPVYTPSSDSATLVLENGADCPTGPTRKSLRVNSFCYLSADVDGKVIARNGTLVVGAGVRVNGALSQLGSGGITVLESATINGDVFEVGGGSINIRGRVDGDVHETGPGSVFISKTGLVTGSSREFQDGSLKVDGTVEGGADEHQDGSVTVNGTVQRKVSEKGDGELIVGPDGNIGGS
jgi:hypothetical protein